MLAVASQQLRDGLVCFVSNCDCLLGELPLYHSSCRAVSSVSAVS